MTAVLECRECQGGKGREAVCTDNVYLTKECILKNKIIAMAKGVCLRHSKISKSTAILIMYFAEIKANEQ